MNTGPMGGTSQTRQILGGGGQVTVPAALTSVYGYTRRSNFTLE